MKQYIAALMAAVMLLAMCCGCGDDKENPDVGAETERFVVEYRQDAFRIILDTVTGERYLYAQNGYGGGLTHLEEPEE